MILSTCTQEAAHNVHTFLHIVAQCGIMPIQGGWNNSDEWKFWSNSVGHPISCKVYPRCTPVEVWPLNSSDLVSLSFDTRHICGNNFRDQGYTSKYCFILLADFQGSYIKIVKFTIKLHLYLRYTTHGNSVWGLFQTINDFKWWQPILMTDCIPFQVDIVVVSLKFLPVT